MEKLISCCGLNCAECAELDTCGIVSQIHNFSPDALQNLKELIH